MGSLPGRPSESAGATGFYDPNKAYPRNIDEPDVNRLAVNDSNKLAPSLVTRREGRITGIATADFDALTAANSYAIAASDTDSWDQPEIAYAASYPFNLSLIHI